MKFALLTVALSLTLSATSALACGRGGEADAFNGDKQALIAVMNGEAHLRCEADGQLAPATVKMYAIYRCIGSPVTVSVTLANGKKVQVSRMSVSASAVQFETASRGQLNCRIDALSAEEQRALDQKKEDAKRAAREEKEKLEREKAEGLAKISSGAKKNIEAAMRAELSRLGYELKSFKLTEAFSGQVGTVVAFEAIATKKSNAAEAQARGIARLVGEEVESLSFY